MLVSPLLYVAKTAVAARDEAGIFATSVGVLFKDTRLAGVCPANSQPTVRQAILATEDPPGIGG